MEKIKSSLYSLWSDNQQETASTESKTEADAQTEVKNLLEMLVSK